MRPETKFQTYADWSGGSWGSDGAVVAATEQPFKYRALNLQVYTNGSIGPRPGWRLFDTTGAPPATTGGSNDYFGSLWVPNGGYGKLLFVSASTAAATRLLDLGGFPASWSDSALDNLSQTDGNIAETNRGDFTFINPQAVIIGARRWYNPVTNAAPTTITYPSSFNPQKTVFYKDRVYAFEDATYLNRVYYSDFGTFDTFSAGNYFDLGVGNTSAATRPTILGAWVVKDQLLFLVSPSGVSTIDSYTELWALQGPNAITGSLVRIAKGRGPQYGTEAVIHHEFVVALDMTFQRGAIVMSPTGYDSKTLDAIRPGNEAYRYASNGVGKNAVSLYGEDALILPYRIPSFFDASAVTPNPVGNNDEAGMQAWELVHGVWTKSIWWNGARPEIEGGTNINLVFATLPFMGDKLLTVVNPSGDLSGTWSVLSRDLCLDRPARIDDTWSDPSETYSGLTNSPFGVNCQLWLPEEMAPLGFGVRVNKVTVEFDYWKSTAYSPVSTADFSVKVKYRGQRGGAQVDTDTQGGPDGSFDYLTANATRYPDRGRRTFTFISSPWYGSYQIVFPTMRNVAFRKVTVEYEQSQAEAGS
jgi:hypothetical protein